MKKLWNRLLPHFLGTTHKKDQQGIMQRYLLEKNNWAEHLENCKKYIVENTLDGGCKIAILGSGWLLDLPLNTLLERYDEVHLFDIHHPAQIQHKYRNNKQIVFQTVDLSNGIVKALDDSINFLTFNKRIHPFPDPLDFNHYDKVISLNLLNQLDILICDKLKSKFQVSNLEISSLRKQIQQQHLDCLPKNKSILISDFEEVNIDPNTSSESYTSLIFCDLSRLNNYKEWVWVFDTHKNYRSKLYTNLRVGAVQL